MKDILLANKELYKLVGRFNEKLRPSKEQEGLDLDAKMLQLANSDLFTDKCLLPLNSSSPEQVAEKLGE